MVLRVQSVRLLEATIQMESLIRDLQVPSRMY